LPVAAAFAKEFHYTLSLSMRQLRYFTPSLPPLRLSGFAIAMPPLI
jgi:hypothetical protein